MQNRAWRVTAAAVALLALAACSAAPAASDGGVSLSGSFKANEPDAATAPPAPVDPTPTPPPPLEPTVAWEACEDDDEGRFECTTVPVPLDHEDPDGETLDIALIRLPAPEAADPIGSLLVNPGGPGGSGVDWVRYAAVDSIPAELRARFHIVGFDPRGVGASSPVSCGNESPLPAVPGLDPDSDADRDAIYSAVQRFTAACAQDSGALLDHVSTVDAARDLDLVRIALGEEKLTYLGYSYGTYLGATYAELFGNRVRALVLDGAVDPSLDLVGRAEGSAMALEAALDTFVAECADTPRCALHEQLADGFDVDDFLSDLAASPVPASLHGGRTLNDGDVRLAMLGLLRDRTYGWPLLEEGIAQAVEGDGSLLLSISDAIVGRGEDVNIDALASLLAVTCVDLPQPSRDELFVAAERLRGTAPRFGPAYLMQLASCASWPSPNHREPRPASVGEEVPPLLVIGTTGDAVTPFAWSEALAAQLDARLLTRNGSQHTAFGGENVCTDRAVIPYLIDLILPPEGWACG